MTESSLPRQMSPKEGSPYAIDTVSASARIADLLALLFCKYRDVVDLLASVVCTSVFVSFPCLLLCFGSTRQIILRRESCLSYQKSG